VFSYKASSVLGVYFRLVQVFLNSINRQSWLELLLLPIIINRYPKFLPILYLLVQICLFKLLDFECSQLVIHATFNWLVLIIPRTSVRTLIGGILHHFLSIHVSFWQILKHSHVSHLLRLIPLFFVSVLLGARYFFGNR